MLTDAEHGALTKWYTRDEVLSWVRQLYAKGALEELEEFLHMTSLFPLSRHKELPDYMLDEKGAPLFPSNLNPRNDEKKWQDAIEVAWQVMEKELGILHDEVHRRIAEEQDEDWQTFMESVERRKRERSGDGE